MQESKVLANFAYDSMNMPQNNIDMLTNSTAEIYDLLGNKVLSCKVALQTQEIDISILNSGVYYIKIGEKIEKIIKI
ncbi:MAG TPA: T9SS type A sorting domain-containing protein [Candidatus Kapabacteria bacterium]|nr:T9SS type A sorting domain-containing protein [Candidatus Kapabacteria bacterium]